MHISVGKKIFSYLCLSRNRIVRTFGKKSCIIFPKNWNIPADTQLQTQRKAIMYSPKDFIKYSIYILKLQNK